MAQQSSPHSKVNVDESSPPVPFAPLTVSNIPSNVPLPMQISISKESIEGGHDKIKTQSSLSERQNREAAKPHQIRFSKKDKTEQEIIPDDAQSPNSPKSKNNIDKSKKHKHKHDNHAPDHKKHKQHKHKNKDHRSHSSEKKHKHKHKDRVAKANSKQKKHKSRKNSNSNKNRARIVNRSTVSNDNDTDNNDDDDDDEEARKRRLINSNKAQDVKSLQKWYYGVQLIGGIAGILLIASMVVNELATGKDVDGGNGVWLQCGFSQVILYDRNDDKIETLTYSKCMNDDSYCEILNLYGILWMVFGILAGICLAFAMAVSGLLPDDASKQCLKTINKWAFCAIVLTIGFEWIAMGLWMTVECKLDDYDSQTTITGPSGDVMFIASCLTCVQLLIASNICRRSWKQNNKPR